MFEFYFRFWSRPSRRNLHVVLHQTAQFHTNHNIHRWNMTPYPCLNMAAATAAYYFRFRICWRSCLQKVEDYQQTQFCRKISIVGWDITIYVFEIETSAMLQLYFRFWSRPFCPNLHVVLPNLIQIRTSTTEIWRHIYLLTWRPRLLNTTSGFVFVHLAACRMSRYISKQNFVEIFHLPAEI